MATDKLFVYLRLITESAEKIELLLIQTIPNYGFTDNFKKST